MKEHLYRIVLLLYAAPILGQTSFDTKWMDYIHKNQDLTSLQQKNATVTALIRLRTEQKSFLGTKEITVLRVLDNEHYVISLPQTMYSPSNEMYSIALVNNEWKLGNSVKNIQSTTEANYVVHSKDLQKTQDLLKRNKTVSITGQTSAYLYIYGRLSDIKAAVLPLTEVTYIGYESFDPIPESTVNDLNLGINNINKIAVDYPNLTGMGITVSVKDNRYFEGDIDLIDKLIFSPLQSDIFEQHPTDMSTIIAGLGNSSINGKGVAPSALLQSSNLMNLPPDAAQYLTGSGIFIQNHSYGTSIENFYGSLAQAYDQHIHENPNELHIFSSGNAGGIVPEDGSYAGLGNFANLTGNFKMGKNNLIIGAINEEDERSPFSSKGPAFDGRIKPELVSYSIIGTSNSTALTSGLSALLQQAYQESQGTPAPAALSKAALINSANDIGAKGPDFATGYGNINGHRAVSTLIEGRYILDEVQPAETKNFSIPLPENAKNLKITLVWTDVPAMVNSNLALINDIDMTVISPSGSTHLPWILNSNPSQAALEASAERGEDHLNNIEQVVIENPSSGEFSIRITGFDISTPSQAFAIAYQWDIEDHFSWNYPLVNDNFPYNGETISYFRWESSFDEAAGELAISYDDGLSWNVIDTQLAIQDGFYLWEPPEDFAGTALARMTIDEQDFLTEPFTISRAININVGLNCEDTVQLVWRKQEGVSAYRVYNLNENTLEPLVTAVDTTFVFNKTAVASNFFSVQPILENGNPGILGIAQDYEVFEAGCYESALIAEVSEDQTAGELSIIVSSVLNVATIEIEKLVAGTFEAIGTIAENASLRFVFLDENPDQGLNTYRVKITTLDGGTFFSEEAELFFLSTTPFAFFPNPVTDGITIFTKSFPEEKVWMEIYSLAGRLLMTTEINSEQQFVVLTNLRQGVYALSLYSEKSKERLAKLIYKL
ncbi:S8 family serine peptidase [Spongiimicrobium salis]|uniref:S8 family serine peptidase n=1 Tax=Spongiimicrobium salis TaxID=1667022 RepID=UPI00374CCCBE